MSLISPANLLSLTGRLGACWDLLAVVGAASPAPLVVGTLRDEIGKGFVSVVTDLDDYEQQTDLGGPFSTASVAVSREGVAKDMLKAAVTALENHIAARGKSVNTTITGLSTFLAYYNGGAGAGKFSNLVSPSFNELYYQCRGAYLTTAGVFSPAVNPTNGSANGMGTRAVGGAFTDGALVDTTKYSESNLVAVVTVNFAGGTAPPTLTIAGTDDTGAATTTWTGTLVGNNPAAAVATTLSAPVTAWTRQTVAVASAAGIAVGSWLTIDANLPTQEVVLVEAVSGSNITAVFKQPHSGGAAVAGSTTLALTPSVGGKRCRDVTNITIGITGHSAGTVRIEGAQDRVPV